MLSDDYIAELLEVLRIHALLYPKMHPVDAVKLIYQNEFGGGHLISDPGMSLERIKKEYSETEKDLSAQLMVDIGCGVCRINLAAVDLRLISLEELNSIFVRSSELKKGSVNGFIAKLSTLWDSFDSLNFTFPRESLAQYLKWYSERGYPIVSHSTEYREAYKPAYRVVLTALLPEHLKGE